MRKGRKLKKTNDSNLLPRLERITPRVTRIASRPSPTPTIEVEKVRGRVDNLVAFVSHIKRVFGRIPDSDSMEVSANDAKNERTKVQHLHCNSVVTEGYVVSADYILPDNRSLPSGTNRPVSMMNKVGESLFESLARLLKLSMSYGIGPVTVRINLISTGTEVCPRNVAEDRLVKVVGEIEDPRVSETKLARWRLWMHIKTLCQLETQTETKSRRVPEAKEPQGSEAGQATYSGYAPATACE